MDLNLCLVRYGGNFLRCRYIYIFLIKPFVFIKDLR